MKDKFSADPWERRHNLAAAELSIIPGMGQIYKGHWLEACAVLAAAIALAVWLGTLASLAYAILSITHIF